MKPVGGDADHGEGDRIQHNRPADDGRVAVEAAKPELVADDRDRVAAWHRAFLGTERPPLRWMDAKRLEVVARDHLAEDALRVAVVHPHVHGKHRVGDEILDTRRQTPPIVLEVGVREAQLVSRTRRAIERDEPILPLDAPQQVAHPSVHPAVHAHVGADAETECQHRHEVERRLPYHEPPAVTDVLRDHFQSPDMEAQPEGVAERAGGANDEARARRTVSLPRDPLPLVQDVGAPLAAPLSAPRRRSEPPTGIDDGQQQPKQGTFGHFRLQISGFGFGDAPSLE